MEDWELDFEWLRIRHLVKEATKRDTLPDLNGVLLMIGVQELGHWRRFTKEEKQDLMHIAVCRLLSYDGVYEFIGLDTEGWPHYRLVSKPDIDESSMPNAVTAMAAISGPIIHGLGKRTNENNTPPAAAIPNNISSPLQANGTSTGW